MDDSKVEASTAKRSPPNAGKGRKKGVPNKTTKAIKEALTEAFEGIGGVESLMEWAKANPTPFYQLWGKLLPLEVRGSGPNGEHVISGISVTFRKPDAH